VLIRGGEEGRGEGGGGVVVPAVNWSKYWHFLNS